MLRALETHFAARTSSGLNLVMSTLSAFANNT